MVLAKFVSTQFNNYCDSTCYFGMPYDQSATPQRKLGLHGQSHQKNNRVGGGSGTTGIFWPKNDETDFFK